MNNGQQEYEILKNLIHRSSNLNFIPIKSEKEFVSFITHAVATILSITGLIALLFSNNINKDYFFALLVYGISTTFLFLCSSIYHATSDKDNEITLWRKLDHIAIYIMIAGTITPICYFYLDGILLWLTITFQWVCVLFGIWLKLYRFEISKKLNISIYLTQGWIAIIPVYFFWQKMPFATLFLIIAGGLLYSIGAIIYQQDRPNPIPEFIGAHEIFHILTIIGAICHYIGIGIIFWQGH